MTLLELGGLTTADSEGLVPGAASIAALWSNVRLAVIDTETIVDGDNFRVVSVAVVTCRAGTVRGKWQTLVNPGVPVDDESFQIHKLSDDHLAGEPAFADVAEVLRNVLQPADDDELVVFVAHKVGFDAGVLRHEYDLLGETLPELRVLDTGGRLANAVGVRPDGHSLAALCLALGIRHDRPHDSMADATVCAEAAVALLNRAAANGERDFDQLLDAVSAELTTLTVGAVLPSQIRRPRRARPLPSAHTETHSTLLSGRAGTKLLAEWRTQVGECARLRCRLLDDQVAGAGPKPAKLLPELEAVLDERATAGDVAGAATVLGAMLPLLPEASQSTNLVKRRNELLAWVARWQPRLDRLGRCSTIDACPACRRKEPCSLDMWPDAVAAAALGDPARTALSFLHPNGREVGTGVYTRWVAKAMRPVADAALWRCVEHWRSTNQPVRASQVAQLAWQAGSRHPDIADAYAALLADAGDTVSLRRALAVTRLSMRTRHDSSHEGWTRLEGRSRQLAGQLERRRFRHSGTFDTNGNPIPIRRHTPAVPQRDRPRRFQRRSPSSV